MTWPRAVSAALRHICCSMRSKGRSPFHMAVECVISGQKEERKQQCSPVEIAFVNSLGTQADRGDQSQRQMYAQAGKIISGFTENGEWVSTLVGGIPTFCTRRRDALCWRDEFTELSGEADGGAIVGGVDTDDGDAMTQRPRGGRQSESHLLTASCTLLLLFVLLQHFILLVFPQWGALHWGLRSTLTTLALPRRLFGPRWVGRSAPWLCGLGIGPSNCLYQGGHHGRVLVAMGCDQLPVQMAPCATPSPLSCFAQPTVQPAGLRHALSNKMLQGVGGSQCPTAGAQRSG
ncbi:hypothetical protein INR49_016455 [Caranx melampygus]|nr:hypothetical protein INR49_016455 [Caranx melampygus]